MWKSGRRPVDPSSRKDERDAIEEAAHGNPVEHNPHETLHHLYKWKHILINLNVQAVALAQGDPCHEQMPGAMCHRREGMIVGQVGSVSYAGHAVTFFMRRTRYMVYTCRP